MVFIKNPPRSVSKNAVLLKLPPAIHWVDLQFVSLPKTLNKIFSHWRSGLGMDLMVLHYFIQEIIYRLLKNIMHLLKTIRFPVIRVRDISMVRARLKFPNQVKTGMSKLVVPQ